MISRRFLALLLFAVHPSSATSASSITTTTTRHKQNNSNNKKSLSPRTLRALEENGYEYLDDLSNYKLRFGKCVRVKVPKDDDDEEGNSYFYNGHYYAQGQQFASVYLCDQSGSGSSADIETSCGVCDTSKEYVTDLATYLETSLGYAQAMCQSCDKQCNNNRQLEQQHEQRTLEEEAAEEEEEQEEEDEEDLMAVDCSTCSSLCKNMNFNGYNGGDGDGDDDDNYGNYAGNDETLYLECQEAFQDEDGYDIYVGPQCNSDGDITIGFYYDDECTVKSSSQSMDFGFEYGTFNGLQEMCLDCNPYGDGEDDVCQELYEDSTHCSFGRNLNNGGDDEDMPICKTYEKAHKEHYYGKHPHQWRIVEWTVAIVLIGGLFWAFLTLSYTYYLRHRRGSSSSGSKQAPLTEHDHHTEPEVTVTGKNGLPPVA